MVLWAICAPFGSILIVFNVTGNPCNGEDDCCKEKNPCGEAEGDCDSNKDCKAGLTCGEDNCGGKSPFSKDSDCCYKGGNSLVNSCYSIRSSCLI